MNNNHLPSSLKIIFWNTYDILHKVSELEALAIKFKIDIILIGEIQLLPNKPLKIINYHTYRSDNAPRAYIGSHAVTAALIHLHIIHKHMVLNTIMSLTKVEISTGNHSIRIPSVYKSTNQPMVLSDLDKL